MSLAEDERVIYKYATYTYLNFLAYMLHDLISHLFFIVALNIASANNSGIDLESPEIPVGGVQDGKWISRARNLLAPDRKVSDTDQHCQLTTDILFT